MLKIDWKEIVCNELVLTRLKIKTISEFNKHKEEQMAGTCVETRRNFKDHPRGKNGGKTRKGCERMADDMMSTIEAGY